MCFDLFLYLFYDIHIFDIHPGVWSRVQQTHIISFVARNEKTQEKHDMRVDPGRKDYGVTVFLYCFLFSFGFTCIKNGASD